MKIINACGHLQEIPFALGERGRGRWFEEVKISNRPGQEPSGPEDVGYFTFGKEKKHVILTKADGKRGILLRVSTAGAYTKGSCGSVALKGGKATLLAEGTWAEGIAGYVANGPDQLWHVEEPSVFVVVLQGGEHKGYGHRYLIVTRSFKTVMIKRAELCQLIATDENPEVTEVARQFADRLHEDVQLAIKVSDELEQAMDSPAAITAVVHFSSRYGTVEETVKSWDLAIPVAMSGKIGGISGVQAGTLMPGDKQLVIFSIGPSGGKRYRFEEVSESGLVRLKERYERPYTRKSVLAMAESPDWHSAWTEYKDGAITAYVLTDAGGEHRFYPEDQYLVGQKFLQTTAWPGHEAVTADWLKFCDVFGLKPDIAQNKPV